MIYTGMLRDKYRTCFTLVGITCFIVLFASGACAESLDESRANPARELARLVSRSEIDKMFDNVWPTLQSRMPQNIDDATLTDLRKSSREVFIRILGEAAESAQIVYEESFTPDEINELLRFYKSSVGQKYLSLMPTVSAKVLVQGRSRITEFQTQMQKTSADVLKAHGYKNGTAN